MRTILVGFVAVLLAACGSTGVFRDRGFDYLRAEVGKPLVYPEGIKPIAAQELYPVAGVEQRKRIAPGEKVALDIPPPPQVASLGALATASVASGGVDANRKVTESQILLTQDGNGYPVLMLDLAFDWAWQVVGDTLRAIDTVKVVDLDRERAVYFVAIDGKRNSAGDPYQLKLNYTSNGIQVALQVGESAMAPKDLAGTLMQKLRDGMLK